jgi:hypothetical protein
MIFSAQPGWAIVGHGVRVAADGPPLHFFELPVVAWRHDKGRLIPMTFEAVHDSQELAVAGPDGKVSIGRAFREDREDYELRVINESDVALEEFRRRWQIKSEDEAEAKIASMAQRRSA